MNLRFVEAFYAIASLKSISRAAEKPFLAQPAMPSRISTLEAEMGSSQPLAVARRIGTNE